MKANYNAKLEKLSLLAEVASMYYERQMSQDEIARRIYTSRSRVSRLLTKAREKGIVEFVIHYPDERLFELERQFNRYFPNIKVRIVNSRSRSYDEILSAIGLITAQYLNEILTDNMILGITWGRTMYHCAKALEPVEKHITVTQVIGAVGSESPSLDAPDLVRQFAMAFKGKYRYLHAPVFVENAMARKTLLEDPTISESLAFARRSDVVLTGIGSLHPGDSSVLSKEYLSDSTRQRLREAGAVGHICAYFFDRWGRFLDTYPNTSIIGLGKDDIKGIKEVIGVGGGELKAEAILGAVRGGYLTTLITDESAARKVMELAEKEGNGSA